MTNKPTQNVQISSLKQTLTNMLIGGTAGTIASIFVYPIDSLKTILQVRSEAKQSTSIFASLKHQIKTNGFWPLYKGVSAGAIRQMLFASLRVGLYFSYSDYLKKRKGNATSISFFESLIGSLGAGALGMIVTMPFDIIYVRYQVDNALPVNQRRNYKGLGDAFIRITKEEGYKALFRGTIPGVVRAMALNAGVLVPYEKCKHFIAQWLGYTRKNYLLSSCIAGFSAVFCCLPFDNAKIKIQKMKPDANGKMPYDGLIDCLRKTARSEGIRALWTGYIALYLVGAPHAMLTLLITDGIRILLGLTKT